MYLKRCNYFAVFFEKWHIFVPEKNCCDFIDMVNIGKLRKMSTFLNYQFSNLRIMANINKLTYFWWLSYLKFTGKLNGKYLLIIRQTSKTFYCCRNYSCNKVTTLTLFSTEWYVDERVMMMRKLKRGVVLFTAVSSASYFAAGEARKLWEEHKVSENIGALVNFPLQQLELLPEVIKYLYNIMCYSLVL